MGHTGNEIRLELGKFDFSSSEPEYNPRSHKDQEVKGNDEDYGFLEPIRG